MQSLRIFFVSSAFTYRALFHWLNPSAYIFQRIGFPLLQLTFFVFLGSFGGARPLGFYLVGNALLVACRPMFSIARAIAEEREQGTLPYVLASPANSVALFFGRSAYHVIDGLLDVVIAFGVATFLFGLDLSRADWAGLALAVVVATFGASTIGMVMGGAAYLVLDATFLANGAMFALLLLSGANVPLEDLPAWTAPLYWALPITRSVEASRAYVAGADFASGLPLLVGDALIGTAWALAGLFLFRWIEDQARRRGTLEGV